MAITVTVPKETAPGERRVALVPDGVRALLKTGASVRVERGAGVAATYPDDAYEAAGAELVTSPLSGAQVVAKVQRPSHAELDAMPSGVVIISLFGAGPEAYLANRQVTALALERVPRITRAQSMDVLSSQATVAGYKAVLVAAPLERRIARIVERDRLDEARVRARMAAQVEPGEARSRADYVIENDGDLDHLRERSEAIFRALN